MRNLIRKFAVLACATAIAGMSALHAQSPSEPQPPGELRVGDRILLFVEGEPTLSDTFTVRPGPQIELPGLGPINLSGVRRDEIQQEMTRELGRFIKHPVVRARALVRVAMLGEVTRPGFYSVPADALLSDAISAAGGPTHDAAMGKLRLERSGAVVEQGQPLFRSLSAGATIEQLDMRSGDQVTIPRASDTESRLRIASLVVGIPLGVLTLFLISRR